MQLNEYSMEDFYQGQLAYLEEEQKKLEKNIVTYKKQMKKAWKRMAADIVLFLFFCMLADVLDADFYTEILMAKYIAVAIALAFAMAIKFFWDLFRLFGEYGLPTFAKLFIGGVEFSCKSLIEEAEVELAKNACKIDALKEEMEKGTEDALTINVKT